tara:strand:- start:58 stop:471 length:414 start_codon:yes stop_codon:yes gene_type:complete
MTNFSKTGNPGNKKNALETFENPHPSRNYTIRIRIPEFTCLCPKTGQPDFATLHLEYIPNDLCIELKSLKEYISGYRNIGTYHEAVTNKILSDLEGALHPRFIRLTAKFNVRGGIYTTVIAEENRVNSNTSDLTDTI